MIADVLSSFRAGLCESYYFLRKCFQPDRAGWGCSILQKVSFLAAVPDI